MTNNMDGWISKQCKLIEDLHMLRAVHIIYILVGTPRVAAGFQVKFEVAMVY